MLNRYRLTYFDKTNHYSWYVDGTAEEIASGYNKYHPNGYWANGIGDVRNFIKHDPRFNLINLNSIEINDVRIASKPNTNNDDILAKNLEDSFRDSSLFVYYVENNGTFIIVSTFSIREYETLDNMRKVDSVYNKLSRNKVVVNRVIDHSAELRAILGYDTRQSLKWYDITIKD